ncbi:MAG: anti-sigma factor family protein [Phycisphaerales bacterium]
MRDYDENLLLGYVEGDLTDAERAKVEQWIAGDPRLEGLLRGLIADRQALRDLPHPEAPAWVLDDVDRRLERSMLLQAGAGDHEQVIVRQRHAARRWSIGLSMAATVLLAAGVVIWSITGMDHQKVRFEVARSDTNKSAAPAPGSAVAVDIDKRRDVADGMASKSGGDAERGLMMKSAPSPILTQKQEAAESINDMVTDDAEQRMLPSAMTGKAKADAEDADRSIEIVVQTRDVAGTLAQLNEVAGDIPHAKLIAELPMNGVALSMEELEKRSGATLRQNAPAAAAPAAPAQERSATGRLVGASVMNDQLANAAPAAATTPMPAPGQPFTYNYQLVIPADQLRNVLDRLGAAPFNTAAQNVAFRRQTQAAQRPLEHRNAAYWPSRSPDYAAILREQLPQSPPPVVVTKPADTESQTAMRGDAAQARANQSTVIVPIVIEFHPVTAAPAMTAPAAPPKP